VPLRQALARHPVAIAGAIVVTASAVVFVALVIAALAGLFRNPYAGLVVFVAIPALFVLGLLLIPLGMWLQRRKLARKPDAAAEDWPVVDFRRRDVRRSALMIAALTAVNIVIVLLAGYGGLHWMESPGFCGQVCHTPMQPQFAAWEAGVHGRVACAQCHIGEGAKGFVHAKLSGVRQLMHVVTNSYPRPIPPGAEMPPGERVEACGRCHQPERASGDRVRVIRAYGDDEKNTETLTVLQMFVNRSAASTRAIHWHADPAVRVEYVSTDEKNETIPYVKVTDASGQVREYRAPDTTDQMIAAGTRRVMDCADCHNAVGHPIAPTPEQALDQAIAAARVSRELPYVRREGLRLMNASYSSVDDAVQAIDREMRSFYQSQGTAADPQTVSKSVAALQDVYRRNVFPDMKVTWGSYPDQKGHFTSNGCFRCHDESHTTKDGATISGDCSYCHDQRQ
jgi:NapC/NirT cytochrome c family, N-terminal region